VDEFETIEEVEAALVAAQLAYEAQRCTSRQRILTLQYTLDLMRELNPGAMQSANLISANGIQSEGAFGKVGG
jgi:hypothetical protein